MLRVTRHGSSVVVLTIDRPQRRNAVDVDTLEALRTAITALDPADDRVMVLCGEPPAFCAGADLTGVTNEEFHRHLSGVLTAIVDAPVPTLAAIDGAALGAGTQLVAACDLRVATHSAVFGIPASRLGLAVDQWTVNRIVDEFGMGLARAMLIAAERIDGTRAHHAGVVHRLATDGDALGTALRWADEIAELAPLSMAAHRAMLTESAGRSSSGVDTAVLRDAVWASHDAEEGRQAFLDKRAPRFTGR